MLKRVYIDNYKSLVNFELNVGPINLLLGPNGSGKSAVFEVLRHIQHFVAGNGKVNEIFRPEYRTRWQMLRVQTFEVDIVRDESLYKYELAVEHDETGTKARVKYERLWVNNNPLFTFEEGEIQLFRDNWSEGPSYPFDWTVSGLAPIMPRHDNTSLTWFKTQLARFMIIQPQPYLMVGESDQEAAHPSYHLENFVAWYRSLSNNQGLAFQLTNELREVLTGFESFRFESVGERHRLLKAYFSHAENQPSIGYRFGELSDGQRMLIALYTLMYANLIDTQFPNTVCLDEPENFVSLPEIQPWLVELYDRCNEGDMQTLLISHHPELINYLLASPIGFWLDRQDNGPTRLKAITADPDAGLPVSELITRRWLPHA